VDKGYIKNYILKSWNLVKWGPLRPEKLFFRMGEIGEHLDSESRQKRIDELASELQGKKATKSSRWKLVQSLRTVIGPNDREDKNLSPMEMLEDSSANQEELL
jgi:hypothetical protein